MNDFMCQYIGKWYVISLHVFNVAHDKIFNVIAHLWQRRNKGSEAPWPAFLLINCFSALMRTVLGWRRDPLLWQPRCAQEAVCLASGSCRRQEGWSLLMQASARSRLILLSYVDGDCGWGLIKWLDECACCKDRSTWLAVSTWQWRRTWQVW